MRKREYRALAEINVTNLVDVVLVLLIIFMISAPLLQSGIDVDLPKTKTATLDESAEGVVVSIDKKGGIFIKRSEVSSGWWEWRIVPLPCPPVYPAVSSSG